MFDLFGSGTAKCCHFKREPLLSEKTLEECVVINDSVVYYVEPAESVFGEHSVRKVHELQESISMQVTQEPNVSDEQSKQTIRSSLEATFS
ncbi:hypothetical protein FRX31_028714 [Thalictrum thalictroides]|uniref:Uncharacterized protein n=1 Tax=Thalictrum thalictroides TaxID=46969 RepID=A0A7J6VAJ6_THATH|nr:hypothetical protein FRX31_028714 [Thalictrum thalictroides]